MERLLRCPPPFPDESFGGYILRLTENNFYPSPKIIYNLGVKTSQKLSSNPYKIDSRLTNLEQLSTLINLPEKSLWAMFLPFQIDDCYPKRNIEKYKTKTHAKYFSTNNRMCIECLKRSKYIKRWWDIFLVTTCPEHSCFLINECPACHKKLRYNRRKIEYCECGFNFLLYESKPVQGTLDLKLSKVILRACNFREDELVDDFPMNFMSFDEIVDSIIAISRSFLEQRYITSPNMPITELHYILRKSLDIFDNWPNNYYQSLEILQEKYCSANDIGIRRFGHFYQLIFGKENRHNNTNLTLLREGFKDFLKSNWRNGNINLLKRLELRDNDIGHVTLSKAAGQLKKSEETVRGLLEKGILRGIIKNNKTMNFYLVESSSIEEYKKLEIKPEKQERKKFQELGKFITKIELERFLSISETTIKELVGEGVLNPISGPEIDNNHTRIYETKELYSFFSMLDSKVKRDIIFDKVDLVSFKEARALINCHFAQFIKYLFSHNITIIKITETNEDVNLNQYYFLKDEVLNKAKLEINGYNIIELGLLLGVSRQSVQSWIQKDFFTFKYYKGRKVIRNEDIELLKKKYIPLVHIPNLNKNNGVNIVKKLKEKGVIPVSGFTIDDGKGYLYVKQDIENISGQDLNW